MVFIIGEAFVDLSLREIRKTLRRQGINGLACLKESDDIVDTNSCTFDSCISTPNTG